MTNITGAHSIVYSTKPDADRAFFRDVIRAPNVDVGGGWLIFGLPPSEVAVHPADSNDRHVLYLICEDVESFVMDMQDRSIECGPIRDQGWGMLTEVSLPGGGKIGVYQPRHARPKAMPGPAPKKPAKRVAKQAPKRAAKVAKKAVGGKAKKKAKKGSRAR